MIQLGRLFIDMALMYPWATKEYLLWEMTIGQIVMYHNIGIEIKNGVKPKSDLLSKSGAELKALRDQIIGAAEGKTETADEMKARYGVTPKE